MAGGSSMIGFPFDIADMAGIKLGPLGWCTSALEELEKLTRIETIG